MSDKNKFSLINLDGASDILIKLLEMIEKAIGWSVVPKGTKADFEEGLAVYKDSIMNDNSLNGIQKSAKISTARKELKQYINQGKIIAYAAEDIKDDARMDVDDDWLMYFFEYAKNISSEKVQKIWSRILAEQLNGDSNISRKLIHTLSLLDSDTALAFGKLCNITIYIKTQLYGAHIGGYIPSYIPIVVDLPDLIEYVDLNTANKLYISYNEYLVSGKEIQMLEDLGLIERNANGDIEYDSYDNEVIIFYNKKKYSIESLNIDSSGLIKKINLGYIKYTSYGEELYKLLKPSYYYLYLDKILDIYLSDKRCVLKELV